MPKGHHTCKWAKLPWTCSLEYLSEHRCFLVSPTVCELCSINLLSVNYRVLSKTEELMHKALCTHTRAQVNVHITSQHGVKYSIPSEEHHKIIIYCPPLPLWQIFYEKREKWSVKARRRAEWPVKSGQPGSGDQWRKGVWGRLREEEVRVWWKKLRTAQSLLAVQ